MAVLEKGSKEWTFVSSNAIFCHWLQPGFEFTMDLYARGQLAYQMDGYDGNNWANLT